MAGARATVLVVKLVIPLVLRLVAAAHQRGLLVTAPAAMHKCVTSHRRRRIRARSTADAILVTHSQAAVIVQPQTRYMWVRVCPVRNSVLRVDRRVLRIRRLVHHRGGLIRVSIRKQLISVDTMTAIA